MARQCNAVNLTAAFLVEFKDDVAQSAQICFGGMDATFIHASSTETFLCNRNIYANDVLTEVLTTLSNELSPNEDPLTEMSVFRRNLAVALFFKFIMSTLDGSSYKDIQRVLSSGKQEFGTTEEKWPLTKYVPSIDGLAFAAGEVLFIDDIPMRPNELWAAFVPATMVNARISGIDPSAALVGTIRSCL